MAQDWAHLSDEELEAIASGKQAPDAFAHLSDDELAQIAKNAPAPDVSKTESFLRGGAQGLTFGFSDEIGAGVGAVKDALLDSDKHLSDVSSLYSSKVADERAANDAAQQANPLTYGTGNVAGGVASSLAGGAALKAGALGGAAAETLFGAANGVSGAMKAGAAAGALNGLGTATGTIGDQSKAALGGGLVGAAAGGVIAGGAKLAKSGVGKIASYFGDPEVLQAKAVGVTTAKKLMSDDVQSAVKIANEHGVFSVDGKTLPPNTEQLVDNLHGALDNAGSQIRSILEPADHVTTTINDIDMSPIDNVFGKLMKNRAPESKLAAVSEFGERFASKFKEGPVSLTDLQEYKESLYHEIMSMQKNAYSGSPAPNYSDELIEAMKGAAAQVKNRIEVASGAGKELAKLNKLQGSMLTLIPIAETKLAKEALQDAHIGSLQSLAKYAVGNTTKMQLLRADASQGLPRTVEGLKQAIPQLLPRIQQQNPGLAKMLTGMMNMPRNKMIGMVGPLVSEFKDYFQPSPYSSLIDNKLTDPADIDAHRQFIQQSGSNSIQKAKELSALNKDGSVIGQLPE